MSMQLDIYLDPKDPEAMLALTGTRALLADTQVAAHWWPLQSPDRSKPTPVAANASRGDRHRGARAEYRIWELEYYAAAQGIEFNGLFIPCDSSLAAMGMNWLQQQAVTPTAVGNYLQALMRNHWAGQRLDAVTQVVHALSQADASGDAQNLAVQFEQYCATAGPTDLHASLAAAAEAGIQRGPGYRLDGEPYLGREHLPILRWIIGGRVGPPPI